MSLTACLIVRDEARDLPGCLASLHGLVDEIVVVDDRSRDETRELARAAGARVFERPLDGFGAQKQWALEQAKGEWVLSIDADERVTEPLADEIRRVLAAPTSDGYEIRRAVYFLGTRMRYGGLGGDWVLRLFRRARGRFTPARVHERIVVEGPVARLRGELEHWTYRTLEEYEQKSEMYSRLAAEAAFARGRRYHAAYALRPGWEFLSRYVLRLGFLDGRPGFLWARLSARSAARRMRILHALGAGSGERAR